MSRLTRVRADALPPATGPTSVVSPTLNGAPNTADNPLSLISRVIPGTSEPSEARTVIGALYLYRGCRLRSGTLCEDSWRVQSTSIAVLPPLLNRIGTNSILLQ